MPRKRTVTARRTTTEQVTITDEDTRPIMWAAGASHSHPLVSPPEIRNAPQAWNAQRRQQVWRAAEIIVAAARDPGPYRPLDPVTLHQAVTILRALPGATPLELTLGRSA